MSSNQSVFNFFLIYEIMSRTISNHKQTSLTFLSRSLCISTTVSNSSRVQFPFPIRRLIINTLIMEI
jgi:hypothetical protein